MDEEYIGVIKLFAGTFAPANFAFCDGRLLAVGQYQALYSIIGNEYGGDGRSTFGLPDLRGRVPIGAGKGPLSKINYVRGQYLGQELITLGTSNMPSHTHDMQGSFNATATSTWSNAAIKSTAKSTPSGSAPLNASGTVQCTDLAPSNSNLAKGNTFANVSPPSIKPYFNSFPDSEMAAGGVKITGTADVSGVQIDTSVNSTLDELNIYTTVVIKPSDVVIGNTGGGTPYLNLQPSAVINYIICLDGLYPSRP